MPVTRLWRGVLCGGAAIGIAALGVLGGRISADRPAEFVGTVVNVVDLSKPDDRLLCVREVGTTGDVCGYPALAVTAMRQDVKQNARLEVAVHESKSSAGEFIVIEVIRAL